MYMNRKIVKLITLFVLVILSANLGFAEDTYKNGVPYVTLNNGQQMPRFGIGTFNVPGDSVATDAVSFALKNGYRHIDTAHAYRVERGVGQGIKANSGPVNIMMPMLLSTVCLSASVLTISTCSMCISLWVIGAGHGALWNGLLPPVRSGALD